MGNGYRDFINSNSAGTSPGRWKRQYAWFPKKINGEWIWREEYFFREVWAKVTKYNGEIKVSDYEWRKEYGTLLDVLRDSL